MPLQKAFPEVSRHFWPVSTCRELKGERNVRPALYDRPARPIRLRHLNETTALIRKSAPKLRWIFWMLRFGVSLVLVSLNLELLEVGLVETHPSGFVSPFDACLPCVLRCSPLFSSFPSVQIASFVLLLSELWTRAAPGGTTVSRKMRQGRLFWSVKGRFSSSKPISFRKQDIFFSELP